MVFDTFSGAWDSFKLDEENFVNYFSSGLSSSQDELFSSGLSSSQDELFSSTQRTPVARFDCGRTAKPLFHEVETVGLWV